MPLNEQEYSKIEELGFNFSGSKPSQRNSGWKMLYFKGIIILLLAVVFKSLFDLQIVNGASFKQQADQNRIYIQHIIAPRGIIYDRNGKPLVYNKDTFNVVIDKNIFNDKNSDNTLGKLANVLNVNKSNLVESYDKESKSNNDFIPIAQDISKSQMIEITTNPDFKGINANPSVVRQYPYKDIISHVLGYTGLASDKDIQSNNILSSEDTIGKDGIELEYDKALRGVDGENIIEVDTNRNKVNVIKKQDPIPGNNITLSIDINVQQKLYESLTQGIKDSSANGGASIIQNPNDGSIIAMVTAPSFDNNLFAQGISFNDYNKLANDPNNPFINRAIAEAQPPGSVMKTITASAALQENAISKDTIFDCEGVFEYGGQEFQDYKKIKRGNLNIIGGLQWSSNIFFYNTILNLGINRLLQYQKDFGAASLTGVDLPGEKKGTLSSPQIKQQATGEIWYGGDSLNAAIGQGFTLVTPIEVVNWINSIANGGTLFKPKVVLHVDSFDNKSISVYNSEIIKQNFVSSSNLDLVRQGMHEAVLDGIDRTIFTPTVDIAAKTGTAEFGNKDSNGNYTQQHAWASGFAPYNKPQISFVVFLEAGGLSTSSEKVAKDFLNWYYGIYLKENPNIL